MTSVRHLEFKNLNFVQIIFGARQHIPVCYPSICLSVTLCKNYGSYDYAIFTVH